jgi:hypothetical protein
MYVIGADPSKGVDELRADGARLSPLPVMYLRPVDARQK